MLLEQLGVQHCWTRVKGEDPAGTDPRKDPKPPTLHFPCSFPSSCCLLVWHKLFPTWAKNKLESHAGCARKGRFPSRDGKVRSIIPATFPLPACSAYSTGQNSSSSSKDLATSFNFPSFNSPKMEIRSIFANPGALRGIAVVKGSPHHGENICFCHQERQSPSKRKAASPLCVPDSVPALLQSTPREKREPFTPFQWTLEQAPHAICIHSYSAGRKGS